MGLSALTEGGEEFAEALAQPLLQRVTYDPDAKIDLADASYQGLVGGTIGALSSGADAMSELDFSDGFLFGFLGDEVTQDPVLLHESLLQAKARSTEDPISWILVDAWDCGLQTSEAKLFKYFADLYEISSYTSITMISQRGICNSCRGVMEQFQALHPDVKINLISNKSVTGNTWSKLKRRDRDG